jgi:hypothetical protein
MSPAVETSAYRWSRVHVIRVLGMLAVALGAVWLVLGLLTAIASLAPWVGGFAAAATAAGLITGAWLMVRPPRLLELSRTGYRIRGVRGAGAYAADWTDIRSVETRASSAGPAIVVDLTDGSTSTLPLSLLGRRAAEAQHEMHERLNAAFGYRRLNSAGG